MTGVVSFRMRLAWSKGAGKGSMRRRDFITVIAGSAAARPLVARAQQPAMPVIGFLNSGAPGPATDTIAVFRQGLAEAGYMEGRNVAIEYRFAEGQYDRLPALAEELVRRQVAVIVAIPIPAAVVAKAATGTIPIVFSVAGDPVKLGLVDSLARPGGNATGVNFFQAELGAKQLGLLRELLPAAARIGLLVNPTNANRSTSFRRATATRSILPSRRLSATKPMRSWSVPIRSSSPGGSSSPPWRRAMRFPPSTLIDRLRKPAA